MHKDSDDQHIFSDKVEKTPSKFLTLIAAFALLFFVFLIIKAFLNIDLNSSTEKTAIIKQLVLDNVSVEENKEKNTIYNVTGRIINRSENSIKNPILKISFKDCGSIECLTIAEETVKLTNGVIPPNQARNFAKKLNVHNKVIVNHELNIEWEIDNIAFFE